MRIWVRSANLLLLRVYYNCNTFNCLAPRRQLEVLCPTRYGYDEVARDRAKLVKFSRLRDDRKAPTETQQAEEAHVKLRYDVFATSSEPTARRHLKVLEEAEQLFRKNRFFRFPAKPLSRIERDDLALLRRLYSQPKAKRKIIDDEAFPEIFDYHPFRDEWPSSNGNFLSAGLHRFGRRASPR